MVRFNQYSGFMQDPCDQTKSIVSIDNQQRSSTLILCIVSDLTDPEKYGKKETFNLPATYSISQFIYEVAQRFQYVENSFILKWKFGNDYINICDQEIVDRRSLSDIGLGDSNMRNMFEIHERDEGPPIRQQTKCVATSSDDISIFDNETAPPKIEDENDTDSVLPSYQTSTIYSSSRTTSTFYNRRNNADDNLYANTSTGAFVSASSSFNYYENLYDTGFVGLINQAMTCYLNSLLQTLFMTPEFRNAIYRWQYKPHSPPTPTLDETTATGATASVATSSSSSSPKKNIPYQLQKLFLNMQTSNRKALHTQDLTQSFGWGSDDAFQQHDVQELCRVMFDALEKMFKGTEQENLINELYQGKIKDYVKCLECNNENARIDVYLDIQLSIKSFGDEYNSKIYDSIESALKAYIEPEILDDSNKYFCTKCNKLCKAHKGYAFESFPYILCLQLKRFDFDYTTLTRVKLSQQVTFPEILDVKPYLSQINNDGDTKYELFSIMIHSGNASGGHYYAYIKCFNSKQWYNFNDERVSRLDRDDIKKAYGVSYSSFSSTAAYMLFYRQIDEKRNEIALIKEQFPIHINELMKREQQELEEAERLKEYLENLCKIKVSMINTHDIENFKPLTMQSNITAPVGVLNLNYDRQCSLHKDLTLEQAKIELAKEFNLIKPDNFSSICYNDYIKYRTRLLKYDVYSELIEQSFDNELITVHEALNYIKQVIGYCWIFEVNNDDDYNVKFVKYKPDSLNIKFIEINLNTYETSDLFNLRANCDLTVFELLLELNKKFKLIPELVNIQSIDVDNLDVKKCKQLVNSIHLAFEKNHVYNQYLYLNDYLNTKLRFIGFLKTNKIFIEYKSSMLSCIDDEKFNKKKFFHTLQTILNLIQITCYLPTNEQCSLYMVKMQRRQNLLDLLSKNETILIKNHQQADLNTLENDMYALTSDYVDSGISSNDINNMSSTTATTPTILADTDACTSVGDGVQSKPSTTVHDTDSSSSSSSAASSICYNLQRAITPPIVSNSVSNNNIFMNNTATHDVNGDDIDDYDREDFNLVTHFQNQQHNKRRNACNDAFETNNYYNEDENELDFGFLTNKINLNKPKVTKAAAPPPHKNNVLTISEEVDSTTNGLLKRRYSDEVATKNVDLKTSKIVDDVSMQSSSSLSSPPHLQQQSSLDLVSIATVTSCTTRSSSLCSSSASLTNVANEQAINSCSSKVVNDMETSVDEGILTATPDYSDDVDEIKTPTDINVRLYGGQLGNGDDEDVVDGDEDDENDDADSSHNNVCDADILDAQSTLNNDIQSSDLSNDVIDENNIQQYPPLHGTVHTSVAAYDEDWDRDGELEKLNNKFNNSYPLSKINTDGKSDSIPLLISNDDNNNADDDDDDDDNDNLAQSTYIKSIITSNVELGTRILEITMDKRINMIDFKIHIKSYIDVNTDEFRVFRICSNDIESEFTRNENQFQYIPNNSKFIIKLGPPLKYGEYLVPVYKLIKNQGFTYICDFTIVYGVSVLHHKMLLKDDIKDESNEDIEVEKMRLRKKSLKHPGAILLNNQVFGRDLFVNATTELCIEILDDKELKSDHRKVCVYLRKWNPTDYELGALEELLIDGNTVESLFNAVSKHSSIDKDNVEILRCRREYPYKMPLLEIHRDCGWRENYLFYGEKIDDGACFYYRDKRLLLGELTDERKRELTKETLKTNIQSTSSTSFYFRKETGVKIHV